MADTPNYNGALQAATARRDAAIKRLMLLGQARQRFTNMMYMKQKAQMAEAERKRQEFEGEGNKSATGEFLGGAAAGASIGAIGGPWGALIGGIVGGVGGTAMGLMESKAQYEKEGKHFGLKEAFKSLPINADIDQASRGKWDPSYINPQAIGSLAMTGAKVKAGMDANKTAAAGPDWANGETETGHMPVYSGPELGSAGAADYYNSQNDLANAWNPDLFSKRAIDRIYPRATTDSAPYPALMAFK